MRTCDQDDCNRRHYGRGLCKPHYLKAWTAGTHTQHTRQIVPAGATLDERLRHHGWTVKETGCWEWSGYRDPDGYGRLAVGGGSPMLASRAAYSTWVGHLPSELVVCHDCDNPPCINPEHLFLGTRLDNNRDALAKQRTLNGENKIQHKLSDEQVVQIRDAYAAGGVSQRALAKTFGVTQQLVSHLVRQTRRPVPTRARPSDD